jgi:ABC-type sulfate/molybdate transport systems ATPase subunit
MSEPLVVLLRDDLLKTAIALALTSGLTPDELISELLVDELPGALAEAVRRSLRSSPRQFASAPDTLPVGVGHDHPV